MHPDDGRVRATRPLEGGGAALYIDLLIKILANTIYEDASIHPEISGPYKSNLREAGVDWPKVAHTMVGVRRLQNVAALVQQALAAGIPGDFIETGVWRGGCCILVRGILAALGVSDRRIFVADSFAGVPPPNASAFPPDEGLNLNLYTELAISLDEVKENFNRYGLLDDQVVFVKGWFSETLPSLDAGPFALIRLDGDLYESTYVALEALYPKLSPGGFVIVDDYRFIVQTKQAVRDYRERFNINSKMHPVDWNAAWWRKE